jgi:hypothetical protein
VTTPDDRAWLIGRDYGIGVKFRTGSDGLRKSQTRRKAGRAQDGPVDTIGLSTGARGEWAR